MADREFREDEYLKEDGLPYCKKCNTSRGSWFDGYVFYHMCKCQQEKFASEREAEERVKRREQVEMLRQKSELGKFFYNCTFGNATLTENNRQVYETCKRYCEKSQDMLRGGYGMYVYGSPGVGKTHLIACMGNALAEKLHTVLFTSFIKLENELKANFGYNDMQERILYETEKVDFLFLDDLGTENIKEGANTWFQSIVFDVINRRYNAKKPTICTSNYTLADLCNKIHYEERTVHRLKEMCSYYTQLDCEIMRDAIAERKRNAMKKLLGGN